MRIVIQRVAHASVTIDGHCKASIGRGMLVLLGIEEADGEEDIDWLCKKTAALRIFDDENGVMNRSILDAGGDILVVSQFTLYADCHKGNRPSFVKAGAPDKANRLYEYFVERCRQYVPKVEHGSFGADMKVELLNDGPFTLVLNADENGIVS